MPQGYPSGMSLFSHVSLAGRSGPELSLPDQIERICIILAGFYLAFLVGSAFQGYWLIDPSGRPIANDFVNVFAAGKLALSGQAVAAYDWTLHKAAENAAVGYAFDGYYNWPYPPTFLFPAVALATLPYIPAALIWLALTLPLYVVTIRAIIGERRGVALALGFAGVVWTLAAGQNGFLTAALVGGVLLLLDRRPVVAGILLGLLTYKPHFGLLFPLVLLLDRRWTVIVSATLTALALAAAAWLAFGSEPWRAFVEQVLTTSDVVFKEGRAGLFKQQTLLGMVRFLGGPMALAWTLHGLLMAASAAAACYVWRFARSSEIKAAALAVAALLITPYLYMYDFPVLAVPIAFLVRLALHDGFLKYELAALAVVSALIIIHPFIDRPTGLPATLIVAALVARRAWRELHSPALTVPA
jgi:arabinofuranan 3-O-arabinosyltransferase